MIRATVSDDVLGGQRTSLVGVGELDLDRRMMDAKAMVQLLRDRAQRGVAGVASWHYQMAGQRRLGGAHAPDVQVVQSGNAGDLQQMRAHSRGIDAFRNCVEREA